MGEHNECTHEHNCDNQWRKPVLFADPQKVPNILKEIKEGFHANQGKKEKLWRLEDSRHVR